MTVYLYTVSSGLVPVEVLGRSPAAWGPRMLQCRVMEDTGAYVTGDELNVPKRHFVEKTGGVYGDGSASVRKAVILED